MLYQWLRVIESQAGVLTERSLANQDESQTLPFDLDSSVDYYYIGKHYPFNNFFLNVDTANSVSSNMKIEYWDATNEAWRDAVDILDGTSVNGASAGKSGVVQFSPDSQYGWMITSDTTTGVFPSELSSKTIYNTYWLRVSFDASLSATTKLERIAYAFTSHQQLDELDTTINSYLPTFNLTDWTKIILTASVQVIRDLRRKGLVQDQGQVLRLDDVSMPTDYKSLELIYRNLGGDYKDKLAEAKLLYNDLISLERYTFDKDNDAFVSRNEIKNRTAHMVR